MARTRFLKAAAPAAAIALAALAVPALADETSAKVVWYDDKNSSLLLECPDKGCPQIPNAKPGETYAFVVPAGVKRAVEALKEGDMVKVVYDDAKEKGYVITAVTK